MKVLIIVCSALLNQYSKDGMGYERGIKALKQATATEQATIAPLPQPSPLPKTLSGKRGWDFAQGITFCSQTEYNKNRSPETN